MKKFVLLLTMAFISSLAFGQSLSLNKHSATVSGTPYDEVIEDDVVVTNLTNSPINVKVRRQIINSLQAADNWFCWDLCYEPTVATSVGLITIPALGDTGIFSGHVNNNGAEGNSVIKYCFYNESNIADSTCMEIAYVITPTSVADAAAIKFSNPYPNPANDNVTFNYTLANTNKATVKIYNMLGALVKTNTITDSTGKLTINTSDLRPGLYLYDLQVSGKSMKTGKFTVTQ
ncbi:MAG: T9SS type A sorting domain-containing protein [Sphingobacteriales bacterium JAD_PAG50586_3]|nr:MAG: T9SS type A sorting domain-containing protein [Sphingobacteriales bacterium JAD_PAG50586_3]